MSTLERRDATPSNRPLRVAGGLIEWTTTRYSEFPVGGRYEHAPAADADLPAAGGETWGVSYRRHDSVRLLLTIRDMTGTLWWGDAYYATRPRHRHDAESISSEAWAIINWYGHDVGDIIIDHIMSTAEEHLPILNGVAPTTR